MAGSARRRGIQLSPVKFISATGFLQTGLRQAARPIAEITMNSNRILAAAHGLALALLPGELKRL
jgi:hypothetical protein